MVLCNIHITNFNYILLSLTINIYLSKAADERRKQLELAQLCHLAEKNRKASEVRDKQIERKTSGEEDIEIMDIEMDEFND